MDKCKEYTKIAALGGAGYCTLELLWRGYTHWTMAVAGALGLLALYWVQMHLWEKPLVFRALVGCLLVTGLELSVGVVVNLMFGMRVWDYSRVPGNFLGQICLAYSLLWYLLCLFVMPVISLLRRKTGGGGKEIAVEN